MFSLDEMIADRKTYFSMMMKVGLSDTALQRRLALEDKYCMYGCSSVMFTNYLSDEIKAAQLQLDTDLPDSCDSKHPSVYDLNCPQCEERFNANRST